MLAPLEVLIYSLVLTGVPTQASCKLKPDETVECSNGVKAKEVGQGIMLLNGEINVTIDRHGLPQFSNGISSAKGATGWIKFSNGIQARRDLAGRKGTFIIDPDLVCANVNPKEAECRKR